MVEKEKVIICDVCGKVVAERKCNLCGNDLCEKCCYDIKVVAESRGSGEYLFGVYVSYCSNCRDKISKLSSKANSFKELIPEIEKEFVDFVRKELIIENLKEEKK